VAENHLATSFQILHKSTIVHIASSQKDSGCPGVEVEVDVPATERDLRAVESWRWIGLAEWISRGFLIRPYAVLSRRGSMFAQWKP